ncbi:MAG: DsbA family oxidoreductase [Enterovirga sp.]|nr:DsbA family oxidoreductase [Enterovirga sp.]
MPKLFVFSDVICPWCYLGKRRLEQALDTLALSDTVSVQWLPFELNPDMPPEGMPRAEYRARKFGAARATELDAHMEALGQEEGVAFAFDRMERTPSTRRAHMLIAHAGRRGRGEAVVEALFRTYFEEGRDVGDVAVLREIARAGGLDETEAMAALESPELEAEVVALERRAAEIGIGGVPFFVLEDGRAVSGAQSSETWRELLAPMAALKRTDAGA